MHDRRILRAERIGGHHPPERGDERLLGVRQECGYPRERLFRLGIKNVEDRADQQAVAGFLPMVAPFERAFGIDQDVGDVLDITNLPFAAPHFQQRVVGRRFRVGRIE